MMLLPFHPRREGFLPAFTLVLLAISFVLTASLLLSHPHKLHALFPSLAFDAALHIALFLALRQELVFDFEGIDRLSGLRRHRIEYNAIRQVELRLSQRPVPSPHLGAFLYLHTNTASAPVPIRFSLFEPAEGQKMLRVLREHAAGAQWNEAATRYLEKT